MQELFLAVKRGVLISVVSLEMYKPMQVAAVYTSEGMEAEVLFEYEKSQDDELDLEVGEVIYNVKEVCLRREGREGLL